MQDYDRFLIDNNIKITLGDNEQYGWKIGVNVKEEFQKHMESVDGFEDEVKERFKNMFNEGRKMLGIHVMSNPIANYANMVYLYKVNTRSMHAQVKDVVFKSISTLFEKSMMDDPLGGKRKWRYGIRSGSVRIKDKYNVYIDSAENDEIGTFVGEEKGVAVSGIINYQSGIITINRVSNANNDIALKFQIDYNELIKKKIETSSSSGGGSSSSGSTVGEKFSYKPYYFERDTFSIDYVGFVEPMKIIWKWSI